MKKFIILAAIAALAGGLQGCQTVPYESGHFISFQKVQASAYHIEVQTKNLAKQLKQEFQSKNINTKNISIFVDLKNTPYRDIYINKLQLALLESGFNLVTEDPSAIQIYVAANVIGHIGMYEPEFFNSKGDDRPIWGELVVNSKIIQDTKLIGMRSDNYYIPALQLPQYTVSVSPTKELNMLEKHPLRNKDF